MERVWNTDVVAFEGADRVAGVRCAAVQWHHDNGRRRKERIAGTEHVRKADLVLLAIGYEGPEREALLDRLDVPLDDRGRVATEKDYTTSKPGVFSAGDATRGASLVVWAIADGRECARTVDRYLTGSTALPTRGSGDLQ